MFDHQCCFCGLLSKREKLLPILFNGRWYRACKDCLDKFFRAFRK